MKKIIFLLFVISFFLLSGCSKNINFISENNETSMEKCLNSGGSWYNIRETGESHKCYCGGVSAGEGILYKREIGADIRCQKITCNEDFDCGENSCKETSNGHGCIEVTYKCEKDTCLYNSIIYGGYGTNDYDTNIFYDCKNNKCVKFLKE